jgi:hypothetical protein
MTLAVDKQRCRSRSRQRQFDATTAQSTTSLGQTADIADDVALLTAVDAVTAAVAWS